MGGLILDDCKIAIDKQENGGENSSKIQSACKKIVIKMMGIVKNLAREVFMLGKDDPRRVIHAVKVGLAISVASLFYLMEPLFDGVGEDAIWAIITVVVVSEFTAGATLHKGLSRGIGTVVAGSLAVLVIHIAELAGVVGEPIIIASFCFIIGATATFFRFFPKIKRKYEYGLQIFILNFSVITVSGYRVDNILVMSCHRLYTMAIGFTTALLINLCISPNWAGEDLHHSIVKRIHALADSLEGCMMEYIKGYENCKMNEGESIKSLEDTIFKGCNDLLDSKTSEQSLASFARWEPGHGKFRFRHPWKQYVKVGGMLRHMAYCVVALHECIHSQHERSHFSQLELYKSYSYKVGMEAAKVMHELGESIKCMKKCPPPQSMMESLNVAVEELIFLVCIEHRVWHVINPDEKNTSPVKITDLSGNPSGHHDKPLHISILIPHLNEGEHVSISTPHLNEGENISISIPHLNEGENSDVEMQSESKCNVAKGVEPSATFPSLVIEMVRRLEHLVESIHELGKLAAF
ncbi:hypothetical protein SUGI_0806630 [Cryptomeria japonica]|nr:hypothetical protein SUGI_0806630 [Cryptomeria japonica]